MDEQFTCFVEMLEKVHVSVPLMDILHVPSYAKYIKDIINNKRPLPSIEVVKLTKECSTTILNHLPEKKKDLGCPTITCSIGTQVFDHALCDLGANISVMPNVVFDKLNYTHLASTTMMLQLADSSVRYPTGIVVDIPVKIWDYFIPVDFMVLAMEFTKVSPLILGRPLLSTVGAQINVGAREIYFSINGKEEKFEFRPRHQEECKMIRIKYGPNQQGIREVEIQPQIIDNLSKVTQKPKKKPEQKKKVAPNKNRKENPEKSIHIPPREEKIAWQPKKGAPRATATKQVWVPKEAKKVETSAPTPLGTNTPSSKN
jgi:hypothetical protein